MNTQIIRWLNICCISVFIMILIGGITRLTQSGLSMVDWKPLLGVVPPLNHEQWEESFNAYKQYPEYKKINQFKKMNLNQYKNIYYWEYAHRIFGRIIGIIFIIPFFIFLRRGYIKRNLFQHLFFAILLVITQGLLGWFMVKSGLLDNPHISHYRLAAHLFLAFLLIGYTYWLKLGLEMDKINNKLIKPLSSHINIIFGLYVLQIVFGAFMAGTKAGLLWNTFPLMDGQLIPDGLLTLKPLYSNFFNNMKMFQFSHRIIGTLLMIYSAFFFYISKDEFYSKYTGFLFMTFLIQFYLGIMTLLLQVPVILGIIHQAIAVLILLIIVHVKFLITNAQSIDR